MQERWCAVAKGAVSSQKGLTTASPVVHGCTSLCASIPLIIRGAHARGKSSMLDAFVFTEPGQSMSDPKTHNIGNQLMIPPIDVSSLGTHGMQNFSFVWPPFVDVLEKFREHGITVRD